MTSGTLDTFICVHRRDVGYMLGTAIKSYRLNYEPKGRLMLITNDVAHLRRYVEETFPDLIADITSDDDWLSAKERELPGWFRQQIIKLRSYEFCSSENYCNLGADTLLLQPIRPIDLVADEMPILYYYKGAIPSHHTLFEARRVVNVARILGAVPYRSLRLIDFINDFFCFNRECLRSMDQYLTQRYGSDNYVSILAGLDPVKDQTRFGEWTLYSTYLLDVLKLDVTVRNAAKGYLAQLHSARTLKTYRFDTKVVHLVSKDFDLDTIRSLMTLRNLELSNHI